MNNDNWLPYGNNIRILPKSKNKIIGDSSINHLWGEVLAVGEDVKRISKGDQISYTLWGLNTGFVAETGEKHYLIQDNPDFILEVLKKNVS